MSQQRVVLAELIKTAQINIERFQKQKQLYESALMLDNGDGTVEVSMITAPSTKGFMKMAKEVIESKKLNPDQKPLHARRIAELVQLEFKIPVDFKSLSQMLYANATVAKRTKYFYKVGNAKNTYGSVGWRK